MKNTIAIIGVLFFIVFCTSWVQQNDPYVALKDVSGFKTKLNQKNQATSTLACDFVQEKSLSFMAQKVLSKGTMKFKNPDMMKLEYTTPFQYIMSLYKGKVLIKDNGKVSKYDTNSNKVFKYVNDLMINAVKGNVADSKEFSIVYKENAKTVLMEMTPIDVTMKDYVNKVLVTVSKADYGVLKVEMTEKSGDYTLITFSNRVYNTIIQDEVFIVR
ncbi:outer membrane lipoprotein carrier protein LolA [uncultured Cytophaga sp.]|uniref:LolA family protein n=1 Tax=uncultured Cytophaga sp. TaxID=160238 RepID=UPI00262AEFAA|nr:outer membrane lipoprotein carrier protein LolA [uncultured Cytophaga sp.]